MNVAAIYEAYFEAVRAGDRRSAHRTADGALESGLPVASLYMDVLQPALREVGRRWQEGEMTVADEHLATGITEAVMARVYNAWIASRSRPGGPTLLASSAESEQHEVGIRMLCDLLELEGWDTICLGRAVPVESLADMVRSRRPMVVALSAGISPHLPQLAAAIRAIRTALPDGCPMILAGGRPFLEDPDLARRLGADHTAASATEAVELLLREFK